MDRRLDVARVADGLYDWGGVFVQRFVRSHYDAETTTILDVGAGYGKYRLLLPEYEHIDGCEVWLPTVHDFALSDIYRNVWNTDVYELAANLDVDDLLDYDVVIMGDVLEHMSRDKARYVLDSFIVSDADVIVVVPYLYVQGIEDDNEYQIHVQDDLTPELMASEYPRLSLVAMETRDWRPFKGIYVGGTDERRRVGRSR